MDADDCEIQKLENGPTEGDCAEGDQDFANRCHQQLEPIDYWASGRPDWSHLAGLTGTRPIVDKYSVTRYSTNEWSKRNDDLIAVADKLVKDSQSCEQRAKETIRNAVSRSDATQRNSSNLLATRTRTVDQWRGTLERAITAQMEEISLLEEQRQRLKKSLLVLHKPYSIASECLDRRRSRPESELIRDAPEEQLVKELALIHEIKLLLEKTLRDIEEQQRENRAIKLQMEHDWSNKKDAFEIETVNCGLTNVSRTTLFKPGATSYPTEQSTEEFWEHFTDRSLKESERVRANSVALRGTLDSTLMNSARDLRIQADRVESALQERINELHAVREKLEIDLKECLRKIVNQENLIVHLKISIRSMDNPMKVAQTRLNNRNFRLQVENCRDQPQHALVAEVPVIQSEISKMETSLKEAERVLEQLLQNKADLEVEIMMKRRTIIIDKERYQAIRTEFPSATELTGFF